MSTQPTPNVEFATPFTLFCQDIVDRCAGEAGRSKTVGIARTASEVFATFDPQNWFEVLDKVMPVFNQLPTSRLAHAPDAFHEGVCNALFTAWLAVRHCELAEF